MNPSMTNFKTYFRSVACFRSAIIYFLSAVLCLWCISCNKVKITAPDDFTVTTPKTTYKVGENVVFTFTGNPDNILFYSGLPGNNYANANASTAESGGSPEMQFLSNVQFGAAVNNLSVLVSTDFNGQYDTTDVGKATWTDITSRVVLGTSATNVSSGVVNLNDLKGDSTLMYLAFKYLSVNPSVNKQKQWTISTFQFRTRFPDGRVYTNAATNADAAFGIIDFQGDSAKWVSGTTLTHAGEPAGFPGDNDWAISKPMALNVIKGDAGTDVKTLVQPPPSGYTSVYTIAGTYKAIFVAQNSDVHNVKRVIREIDLTVTP
jgi:hypothetical protein